MPKMTEEQLVSAVKTEFKNAMGTPGGEISLERARAMDRFLSKPMGNEEEGQSEVVTSDVSDVIDGIMPSLLRMFTTADNLVSFDPVENEDQALVDQESDYVTHVFFKEQRDPTAFILLFYWFFDALLQKNGIVMAYWDESEKITYEKYAGLTEDKVTPLLNDPELKPLERSEDEDPETGETLHTIKFRREKKRPGQVKVDNVPPDEFRISSDSRSVDPSGARMVGRERNMPRSDLIEMGFDPDQVKELPVVSATSTESAEQRARKDKSDEQNGDAQDKSRELVKMCEAYIKVDFDGDGRSELMQVFLGGDKLLRWKDGTPAYDTIERQPFHVLCPSPLPHKHFGRCPGEKVIDVQDTSSTLLRQVLDNLYHTNNPGHAVWEQGMSENTLDDLLTTRVGRVARFNRPVGESYAPMTVPFTAGATFPMLEYFDKVKRDRTGISSDGEGLSPEALKNIQTSVLAASVDISKMKVEAIARIFAETGIKSLFEHIHELLMRHQDKKKIVRLRNEYVEVDPRAWKARENVTINVGLGIGTREQNLLHLNSIAQFQEKIVGAGMGNLVVTPKNIYNTAAEIVKNANMKLPGLYFTDPGDAMAPPPQDEQTQLQKMQAEIEQRQQQLDHERHQIDAAKLELKNKEMALDHRVEIMRLQEQAEERQDKFMLENEKLRNQLAAMIAEKLERGEKLPLELDDLRASIAQKRATTAKIIEDARALDLENDAAEAGLSEPSDA